jgi:hypothetical protein
MRQREPKSIESSLSAPPDALIALARLLARQAAREFVLPAAAPPDTSPVQDVK